MLRCPREIRRNTISSSVRWMLVASRRTIWEVSLPERNALGLVVEYWTRAARQVYEQTAVVADDDLHPNEMSLSLLFFPDGCSTIYLYVLLTVNDHMRRLCGIFPLTKRLYDRLAERSHTLAPRLYTPTTWTIYAECSFHTLHSHRYWHMAEDGCYIVALSSMEHRQCPADPGYVRGEGGVPVGRSACR